MQGNPALQNWVIIHIFGSRHIAPFVQTQFIPPVDKRIKHDFSLVVAVEISLAQVSRQRLGRGIFFGDILYLIFFLFLIYNGNYSEKFVDRIEINKRFGFDLDFFNAG